MSPNPPESLFDRFCRRNGQGARYEHDRPELQWFLRLVEQFRFRCNDTASVFFGMLESSKVHVDVVNNDNFNAFAAIEEGLNLVAITSGALHCLYPIAGILARYSGKEAQPDPQVRSILNATTWTEAGSVDSCCDVLLQIGPLVPPHAQQRHTKIFWHMINVVLHHEFAHLYMGHVGFLREQSGLAMASEARSRTRQSQTEQWHAMEIQADMGICMHLTSLQRHGDEFEIGILASLVVFFLLYDLSPDDSFSHPHPVIRLFSLVQRVGNESRYDDGQFNALLDRIKMQIGNLGLFESTLNLPLAEVGQRSHELERVSNEYLPLFAQHQLTPAASGRETT